jgi:hypothetical protein
MTSVKLEQTLLDEVRQRRAALIRQIEQSRLTIERSTALLEQIDEILGQAEKSD